MHALYPSVLFFTLEEGEPGNEEVGHLTDDVLQFNIGDGIGRDHIYIYIYRKVENQQRMSDILSLVETDYLTTLEQQDTDRDQTFAHAVIIEAYIVYHLTPHLVLL